MRELDWYDDNGNQVTRIVGPDTYTQIYDAENRMVEVKKNGTTMARFDYNGDGQRVESVIGNETILLIGGHFEVLNPGNGQTVIKYYFAGASRVAMRKYTIPQNMEVEYLLGDHLGSTSLPCRKGLVRNPEDWRFSSAGFWMKNTKSDVNVCGIDW